MLDWKIHLIFGLLLVIFWFSIFFFSQITPISLNTIIILVALSSFTTLLPDIDLKNSKIRHLVSLISAFVIAGIYIYKYSETWYLGIVWFVALYILIKKIPTKHRGITHTYKFAFLFSAFLIGLFYFYFTFSTQEALIWFAVTFSSYSFHLLLDRM